MAVTGEIVEVPKHSRDEVLEFFKPMVSNPLVVGLGLLALNNALFVNGAYDFAKSHPRSALGGPVWFQIGNAQSEDEAYWTRIELFIMTVTALQAAGGLGESGIGGLINSLKAR